MTSENADLLDKKILPPQNLPYARVKPRECFPLVIPKNSATGRIPFFSFLLQR